MNFVKMIFILQSLSPLEWKSANIISKDSGLSEVVVRKYLNISSDINIIEKRKSKKCQYDYLLLPKGEKILDTLNQIDNHSLFQSTVMEKNIINILGGIIKGSQRLEELYKLTNFATPRKLSIQLNAMEKEGFIVKIKTKYDNMVKGAKKTQAEYLITSFGHKILAIYKMLGRDVYLRSSGEV